MLQIPLNIKLDNTATFVNFFAGNNVQLLERLKSIPFSLNDFVFVWGKPGTGKSHLAQAACQEVSLSGKNVAYFPLSNKSITVDAIKDLEGIDFVCLDSFECVAENSQWEVATFNLYNQLKERGKQLVVFSKLSPFQLQVSLADLQSRLAAMEIYKINEIDDESKIEFLVDNSAQVGIELTREVATFVVNRSGRSISELAGVVKRLDEESLIQKRRVTIPFVKQIFSF